MANLKEKMKSTKANEEAISEYMRTRLILKGILISISSTCWVIGFLFVFFGVYRLTNPVEEEIQNSTQLMLNSHEIPPQLLSEIEKVLSHSQKYDKVEVETTKAEYNWDFDEADQPNPYRLSPKEIEHQYESAHIPSLKSRVKRFACWHSCFGAFRRKAFRMPFGKHAVVNVTRKKPEAPMPSPDDNKDGVAPATNELGDGGTKGSGKRLKKSPGALDYFNLKTKVVKERDPRIPGASSATAKAPSELNKSIIQEVDDFPLEAASVNGVENYKESTNKQREIKKVEPPTTEQTTKTYPTTQPPVTPKEDDKKKSNQLTTTTSTRTKKNVENESGQASAESAEKESSAEGSDEESASYSGEDAASDETASAESAEEDNTQDGRKAKKH